MTTDTAPGFTALHSSIKYAIGKDISILVPRLIELTMSGAKAKGFCSSELTAPSSGADDWRLVQRFSTVDRAQEWCNSSERTRILQALAAVGADVKADIGEEGLGGDAATLIVTDVKPGMEQEYFDWESKIQIAQAQSKGYRGAFLQPPTEFVKQWSTLVHYDSSQSLKDWLECDVRKGLVEESNKFVEALRFEKVATSFPGWFPTNTETGQPPPPWKTSLIVLMQLFPIVMLEVKFLSPLMSALNPALATLLNLILSVIITTWMTMPIMLDRFKWWLYPKEGASTNIHATGTVVCILLFALELALTWNFFTK